MVRNKEEMMEMLELSIEIYECIKIMNETKDIEEYKLQREIIRINLCVLRDILKLEQKY